MSISPAVLVGGATLGTSSATLYLTPANTKAVVKRAVFTNAGSAAVTITVTVTRAGGSAFTIISAQSLSAGQAYVAPELSNLVLAAGDILAGSATATSSVNVIASGFVVS